MKKGTKQLLGGLAIVAGSVAATRAYLTRNSKMKTRQRDATNRQRDVWARPGMSVIFRAELMPGRETTERTFRIKELLPSGRVLLDDAKGEHAEKEFESVQ
jgi:hypothetical protein